jgi:hypothetical protein
MRRMVTGRGRLALGSALAAAIVVVAAGTVLLISRSSGGADGTWHLADTHGISAAPEAVACPTSTNCWVVGWDRVEHLSGGAWTGTPLPALGGEQGAVLFGVACPTPSECWGVGQDYTTEQIVIGHEMGDAWTLIRGAGDVTQPEQLNAIACVGPADCWAVGDVGPIDSSRFQPLIEHYSGTGWSVVPSPDPGSGGDLTAVSCPTATECWAVGTSGGEGDGGSGESWTSPLIEHYEGDTWTVATTPGIGAGGLTGVACSNSNGCWAVGHSGWGSGAQPLVEHGVERSWSVVGSPSLSGPDGAVLSSVACTAPGACWAVGELPPTVQRGGSLGGPTSGPTEVLPPVIEGNAGGGWSVVVSPQIPGGSGSLTAVTCVASRCWAIGSTLTGGFVAESTT